MIFCKKKKTLFTEIFFENLYRKPLKYRFNRTFHVRLNRYYTTVEKHVVVEAIPYSIMNLYKIGVILVPTELKMIPVTNFEKN